MRWTNKLSDNIKRGLRNWLRIEPANPKLVVLQEMQDFEFAAFCNRAWNRGDSNELEQLYQQIYKINRNLSDKYKFWASTSTPGMEMRKLHTGLPGLIVRILSGIVIEDMGDFEFENGGQELLWKDIEKENDFRKVINKALKDILVVGDGAYKVTIDTSMSQYPILEWYPGDQIEIINNRGRLKEVVFKTPYFVSRKQYTLYEYYGYGYIRNELYCGELQVDINSLDDTKGIKDVKFDDSIILAVPLKVYESTKYPDRGSSIFDGKLDSFDAFDEVWSQWMDALRSGRARTYIPESYIPRDKNTGELMQPNPFDNRFIAGDDNLSEDAKNVISTEQPAIPHDSYLASYVTALDLCLQGIISPSTLGIDVKKIDNAEAQREKEKATLYTRNAIVEALQETLPDVISACINAYHILFKQAIEDVVVNIPFGEYANPSFESQVETVGKARTQGIMSIDRCVEELYGDTLDEHCKQEEIARLKYEQGIASVEEPALNLEGVNVIGSQGGQAAVPNEPEGIRGIATGGQRTGATGDIRPGKE